MRKLAKKSEKKVKKSVKKSEKKWVKMLSKHLPCASEASSLARSPRLRGFIGFSRFFELHRPTESKQRHHLGLTKQ
jgi:hypothetical protein